MYGFFTGTEVSENVIHNKKYLNSGGFKKKDAGIRAAVIGPIFMQFSVKLGWHPLLNPESTITQTYKSKNVTDPGFPGGAKQFFPRNCMKMKDIRPTG